MKMLNVGDKVRFVEDSVLNVAKVGDRGVIIQVDKRDKRVPYLVSVNGREVWCQASRVVPDKGVVKQKIVITTDGVETLARMYEDGKVVKCATAKCAPDDEFDFNEGARIAFERLVQTERAKKLEFNVGDKVFVHNSRWGCNNSVCTVERVVRKPTVFPYFVRDERDISWWLTAAEVKAVEKKDVFVPHLVSAVKEHYGNIGEPTNYKDAIGRKLRIGDTVDLFNDENEYRGECAIVKNGKVFVMGIRGSCCEKSGTTGDWKIIKKRSHTDVSHGEAVGEIKFVKKR